MSRAWAGPFRPRTSATFAAAVVRGVELLHELDERLVDGRESWRTRRASAVLHPRMPAARNRLSLVFRHELSELLIDSADPP